MWSIISPWEESNPSSETQTTKSFEKDPMELCIYAQQEVPQLLKSPTTAKFPSCSNINLDWIQLIKFDTPDLFAYQWYVDAQNSFWAKLREQYWCSIQYKTYPEYAIKCIVSEPNSKQAMKEVFRAISVPEDELNKL
jgi:hypothetical protein